MVSRPVAACRSIPSQLRLAGLIPAVLLLFPVQVRGGHSFVAVVMGWPTAKSRDQQMESLIGSYLPGATVASTAEPKRPERLMDPQTGASSRPVASTGPTTKARAASAANP